MINKTQLNKLRTLIDKNKAYLDPKVNPKLSDEQKYSMALSMSILMEYASLNPYLAYDSLTDGSGDNKIDAFYFTDDENELSEVTIIQAKYKVKDGDNDTFNEDEIIRCITKCEKFSRGENFQTSSEKLESKINGYRILLKENDYPPISIKLFFATNGIIHEGHKELKEVLGCFENNITPIFVDATDFGFSSSFQKGELLVNLKNSLDETDSIFRIEDDQYSGMIASCSLLDLMEFYKNTGERQLLNTNVRYLIKKSRVNHAIETSFKEDPVRFCYLNNGITILCDEYDVESTGHPKNKIILTKPSIVNGGQTMATIYSLFRTKYEELKDNFMKAHIVIRIYKSPKEYSLKIAKATNSQNPINPVDLRANDKAQGIAKEFFEKQGVGLLTKIGEEITFYDDTITNEYLLQLYASLYYGDPAKAKTSKAAIWKKYYDLVFKDSIDEQVCKKLFRCYKLEKFVFNQTDKDQIILQNAQFSIIYSMSKYNKNVNNEHIPNEQVEAHFVSSFKLAYELMERIIQRKTDELKSKFSMNNLFKGSEIKDLIDLEFEENLIVSQKTINTN